MRTEASQPRRRNVCRNDEGNLKQWSSALPNDRWHPYSSRLSMHVAHIWPTELSAGVANRNAEQLKILVCIHALTDGTYKTHKLNLVAVHRMSRHTHHNRTNVRKACGVTHWPAKQEAAQKHPKPLPHKQAHNKCGTINLAAFKASLMWKAILPC
jgi:hypothetical protein